MTENVRKVQFTVDGDSISPSNPQWAGVQGEHRATRVEFIVPEQWTQKGYRYRMEYVDGMQTFFTSDLISLEGTTVGFLLPDSWTAAGGTGEIRLVAYLDGQESEDRQLIYSRLGRLTFSSRDEGTPSAVTVHNHLSYLLTRIERAVERSEGLPQYETFEQGESVHFGNGMTLLSGTVQVKAKEPLFVTFPCHFETSPTVILNRQNGVIASPAEVNQAIFVIYDEQYSGPVQWCAVGKRKKEEE
jgi:hypothetical protein